MPIASMRPSDAESIRAGRRAVITCLIVLGAFFHLGAVFGVLAIIGVLRGVQPVNGVVLWDLIIVVALLQGLLAASLALLMLYRHRMARVAYWSWTTSALVLTALFVARPDPSWRNAIAVLVVLAIVAAVGYGIRVRFAPAG